MSDVIKIKSMTLEQYRKYKDIKVIPDIQDVIHIPTYYRIRDGKNKNKPQDKSLEKLRVLFDVDEETFNILLENQLKG